MSFRRLWFGCLLRHGEVIWTHDVMTCLQCGTVIKVLPQATIRGPAHTPEPVRGKPQMFAKVERRDNVRDFRQSERISER